MLSGVTIALMFCGKRFKAMMAIYVIYKEVVIMSESVCLQ